MADVFHDRVRESGTGTAAGFTLLGAIAQYQSFSVVGNGNTCRYTVVDADGIKWGAFGGTWSTGGTLSRTTVYETSAGIGVDTTFSAGVHQIFLTPDATAIAFIENPNIFTAPQTVAGSANSIVFAGAAATLPVTITAIGTDASVPIQLVPKGNQGFVAVGKSTYGAAGWAGFDVDLEVYTPISATDQSIGIHLEKGLKDVANGSMYALEIIALTQPTQVNGGQAIWGANLNVVSRAPVGITNLSATGASIGGSQNGAGTVTNAVGGSFQNTVTTGVATNSYGMQVLTPGLFTGGTIGTNYGIRIEDQAGAGIGTGYACSFGLGFYHFDGLTASSVVMTDASKNLVSSTNMPLAGLEVVIGDRTNVLTTGIAGDVEVPFACTIVAATLLADAAGSVVVDIWKDTYANYPPTGADSITAAAPPTIAAATKAQDTTLTGWTTAIAAGDTLRFNVNSAATIKQVVVSLKLRKAA